MRLLAIIQRISRSQTGVKLTYKEINLTIASCRKPPLIYGLAIFCQFYFAESTQYASIERQALLQGPILHGRAGSQSEQALIGQDQIGLGKAALLVQIQVNHRLNDFAFRQRHWPQ